MPGHRLAAAATPISKFAVAGTYARPGEDAFVRHIAIVQEDCRLAFDGSVDVWHCSPPIVAGERTNAAAGEHFTRCEVHAISFLDDLSPDEVAGMETTLAEIDAQTQPVASTAGLLQHYVVHPPVQWITDEQTGRKRFRRFSCVGFVCECYAEGAGIRLLGFSAGDLPAVDVQTLATAYGDIVRNEVLRKRLGIGGAGPWHIALPGYVLHALSRPGYEVRREAYVPGSIRDASFPLD